MSRARLATLVGVGVGVLFLWLFARDLDPGLVLGALEDADPRWLGLCVLAHVLLYGLKAWRWGTLLHSPASLRDRWDASLLGFGANCVLPGRIGEAVRVGALHRMAGVPLGEGVSSLVLERLADVMTLAFLLGAGAAALGADAGPLARARQFGVVVALGSVAALPLLGWAGARPAWMLRLARRVGDMASEETGERLEDLARTVARGLAVVSGGRTLVALVAQSLVHWGAAVGCVWTAARALGVELGAAGAAVVLGATAFAVALPQAPGYLGPFQWAVAETSRILGADPSRAAALAILFWALSTGFPVLVSAGILLRRGRQATAALEDVEALEEETR